MKKKYSVRLTDAERQTLQDVVFAQSSHGCRTKTVENIRQRLETEGFEARIEYASVGATLAFAAVKRQYLKLSAPCGIQLFRNESEKLCPPS